MPDTHPPPPTPPDEANEAVRAFLAEAGRKGGQVKSEAKTAAARENAKRPRRRGKIAQPREGMMVVTISRKFYTDRENRELPTGTVVKERGGLVTVEVDAPTLADIKSDADYYADPYVRMDAESNGIKMAAKAVLRQLKAQGH